MMQSLTITNSCIAVVRFAEMKSTQLCPGRRKRLRTSSTRYGSAANAAAIEYKIGIAMRWGPPRKGQRAGQMTEGTQRNARMRSQGTQDLVTAALGAGVRRLVAQSIAWMYAPGKEPHSEDDLLDIEARGTRAITVAGVATLERLTISSPPIDGVVLRYGRLYGPGTRNTTAEAPALHVDAAAWAVVLREGASRHLQHRRTERIPLNAEGTARARL
jgi:hypothetical protein